MNLQMTLEASCRIVSWIDNKLAPSAAASDVFAAGSMAGFASAEPNQFAALDVDSGMRAGGKNPGIVGMALGTYFIAHELGVLNLRRHNHRAIRGGTGN